MQQAQRPKEQTMSARKRWMAATLFVCSVACNAVAANAQAAPAAIAAQTADIPESSRVQPSDLVAEMKSAHPPLILQVGSHLLFQQAHIPGAEYAGAAGTPEGLATLRTRVQSLPHDSSIVIYCGCCPWVKCPNIRQAFAELQKLGFTHVRALYLPQSFGADWTEKGLPTSKGDS
jgi:thiosulfate/3-mercaptopyruvate sulfurtransferase